MGGPRSKATPEQILEAFHTDEPFKKVAARLGMSPNTLRGKWKAEFGEDAFKERGKTIQARAAAKTAKAISKTRVYSDVEVLCSKCGEVVVLKSNQTAQIDVSAYVCDECRGDRDCPVCGQRVDGVRGLSGHFRHRREAGDEAHISYETEESEAIWEGKVEGQDYVLCLVCGHRAETLARHLKSSHGITADEYRSEYGEDAPIRSDRLTSKRSEAMRNRDGGFGKGEWKDVTCPACGDVWEGSKFLVPGTHDLRCQKCKKGEEDAKWVGKVEGEDYVVCRVCGHKAENLTSHIRSRHPWYRKQYPDAPVVASGSAVRDKTALKGRTLSDETRQRMSENAGRWNKGLTKETDDRVAASANPWGTPRDSPIW